MLTPSASGTGRPSRSSSGACWPCAGSTWRRGIATLEEAAAEHRGTAAPADVAHALTFIGYARRADRRPAGRRCAPSTRPRRAARAAPGSAPGCGPRSGSGHAALALGEPTARGRRRSGPPTTGRSRSATGASSAPRSSGLAATARGRGRRRAVRGAAAGGRRRGARRRRPHRRGDRRRHARRDAGRPRRGPTRRRSLLGRGRPGARTRSACASTSGWPRPRPVARARWPTTLGRRAGGRPGAGRPGHRARGRRRVRRALVDGDCWPDASAPPRLTGVGGRRRRAGTVGGASAAPARSHGGRRAQPTGEEPAVLRRGDPGRRTEMDGGPGRPSRPPVPPWHSVRPPRLGWGRAVTVRARPSSPVTRRGTAR